MKTKFFHVVACAVAFLLATSSNAQTFITKASGNWSDPTIWEGGVVPAPTIPRTTNVIIKHKVIFNYTTTNLQVSGGLQVLGDTLQFPAGFAGVFKLSNATSGLLVKNGAVIQQISGGSSQFIAVGSYLSIDNSYFAVDGDFTLQNGGTGKIINSTVRVGTNFTLLGNETQRSKDTLLYSSLSAGLIRSADMTITYGDLVVANADVQLSNSSKLVNNATGTITTGAGAASGYGFDVLKGQTIINDGSWIARIFSHCIANEAAGLRVSDIDFTRAQDCNLTSPPTPIASNAGQMVINEVYTDPAVGKNEFVELYNINNQPEQMDNYTFVTYFNDGTKQGFYVLDLPKVMVEPKGLYVYSSAFPLNFQGATNSIQSSLDWSKTKAYSNSNLKKWVYTRGGGNQLDGNPNYDEEVIPSTGFNNVLYRVQSSAAFTFLLYKNGMLINKIIAGSNSRFFPDNVATLPSLFVDMTGSSPDFTINFESYKDTPIENITADAGNDNGFTRKFDGACGTFQKSSAAVKHTPMASNGPIPVNSGGDITVTSSIFRGSAASGSVVQYTVTAASTALPVEMRIVVDDGTVPGQLDVMDTQVDYKTATSSGQTFSTTFQPYDSDVFILIKQGTGCIDRLIMPTSEDGRFVTLPVNFVNFKAHLTEGAVKLNWSTEGEEVTHFEVERSTDGQAFSKIGTLSASDKTGGSHQMTDRNVSASVPAYYYRIKALYAGGKTAYSSIQTVRLANEKGLTLVLYPNPVWEKLFVSLPGQWQQKPVYFELFNANGVMVRTGSIHSEGATVTVNMALLPTGLYLLKATCGTQMVQQRIIKN